MNNERVGRGLLEPSEVFSLDHIFVWFVPQTVLQTHPWCAESTFSVQKCRGNFPWLHHHSKWIGLDGPVDEMRLRHTSHKDHVKLVDQKVKFATLELNCNCFAALLVLSHGGRKHSHHSDLFPSCRNCVSVSFSQITLALMQQTTVSCQLCTRQFCGERGVQRGLNGCGHVSQSFPMFPCPHRFNVPILPCSRVLITLGGAMSILPGLKTK